MALFLISRVLRPNDYNRLILLVILSNRCYFRTEFRQSQRVILQRVRKRTALVRATNTLTR